MRILGILPADCAITTVFAGAIAATASDPRRAAEILQLLSSEDVAAIKTRHSFGIPDARPSR